MRKGGFVISLALVALGLVGLWRIANGSAAMAIDFSGGSSLTVQFEKAVPVGDIRAILEKEIKSPVVQQINEGAEYLIRMQNQGTVSETGEKMITVTDQALHLLEAGLSGNKIIGSTSEEVGPSVSHNLRVRSIQAVGMALLGILLYIMMRFGQRFSVGAVVATLHDILAVIGLVVLLNIDFSLLIVVSLLTLAGYSLNDTVVVYDRIRENQNSGRSRDHKDVINSSLNEVLSRTINTSFTTLLVLGSLYFLGGEVFSGFALSLILGIVIGTYSSLFVASPLVYEWNLRRPPR